MLSLKKVLLFFITNNMEDLENENYINSLLDKYNKKYEIN